MYQHAKFTSTGSKGSHGGCKSFFAALLCTILMLASWRAFGQASSGTLSGTVTDISGAVIPNAQVVLENSGTHDTRKTVSDGSGFFSIAAVPIGTYSVTVTAPGYATWEQTDIVFHQGQNLALPKISMKVATAQENVKVVSSAAGEIPLDTGESTTTLNTEMVTQLAIQGRDAAELMKFMPAMSMNTGLGQGEYNSQITSTNGGPIGAFSASGTQPYGGTQMTLDGADLVDLGNQGTQLANINQDQTAEITYLNGAFGADTPRGPTILQAISKSGTSQFHGGAYFYGRNSALNAEDAYLRAEGNAKPQDHEYYPGFDIGGPVAIPALGWNKFRDKLFFFAGYEYMDQMPSPTLHQLLVPDQAMRQGNFSPTEMATLGSTGAATQVVPCAASNSTQWYFNNFCGTAQGKAIQNGIVPASLFDPNGVAMMKSMPLPNQNPATHQGYNYAFLDGLPVNRWELKLRGDYDPTASDKFSLIYTRQSEADLNNFGVWWNPGDTLPYPSQFQAQTLATLWTANYVHVFNPTTTNEFIFAYTYFTFPPRLANPSAANPATYGYTAPQPFQAQGLAYPQIPNLISWGCSTGSAVGCFPGYYAPPMISGFNNGYGNIKKIPSFQDNVTRVMGTHSLKFGFFWDDAYQSQTSGWGGPWPQGAYEFDNWSNYGTGNPMADLLLGHAVSDNQGATAPIENVAYHEYSFYGQDQWHATHKLTLDYGVRFDHEGQWAPTNAPGYAVFNPAAYDNSPTAPLWTGIQWHATNSRIPKSGFSSSMFSPDLRVGGAYDIAGDGKTVLRGGFGVYRWQFSANDVSGGLGPSLNVTNITTPGLTSFADAATYKPTAGSWCALSASCPSATVLAMGDNKTPYTEDWDVVVDRETVGHSVVELQYAGNRTRNALLTGTGLANINKIPIGAEFGPDKINGVNYWATSCATGKCTTPTSTELGGYVPYLNYSAAGLDVVQHGSYSNYNAFIASWQKQAGRYTFMANYTFSKVMGIRDGQTDNGNGDGASTDYFNLRNNYGPLAYDRTHIFNATYIINLPSPLHGNRFAAGTVNGWQLSGDTQFQSGTPLQPNTGGTFNAIYNGLYNQQNILGTTSQPLLPILTCNPKYGGGKYFNPNCFTAPTVIGENGPTIWPYIKGPAFFNTDLGLYKNFAIHESQNVQLRITGFNILNHPLYQFGLTNDDQLTLGTTGFNTNSSFTGSPMFQTGRRVVEVAAKYNF
jgi:hypothetical protein